MGYSFTNLQLRCAGRFDPDEIAALTAGEGWERVEDAEQADVSTAIYVLSGSPWVTVRSDAFEDDPEALIEAGKRLSQALDADALAISCFDSDYLFLNLLNPGKKLDLWANGGHPAALGMTGLRRSNFRAWKDHVSSVTDFRSAMKHSQVFGEDCLYDLADVLSLPVEQSLGGIGEIPEGIKARWYHYRASVPQAQGDPPSLEFLCPMAYHALDGKECMFTVCNYGGASKGLTVVVEGVEAVEDAKTQVHDRRGNWILTPVKMDTLVRKDGTKALYVDLFDLALPAVNRNLPPKKLIDTQFDRGVSFRFVPRNGQEGELLPNMRVTMIPLMEQSDQNQPDLHLKVHARYAEGGCTWQGRMPSADTLERMQSCFQWMKEADR